MFTLGVILARAGSKGLPDKCVRPLLGRALIEFTFDHAQAARLDALVLTTDSEPAKQLARARAIEVVDRPAHLADDAATVDAAARHAVQSWEGTHRRTVDAVVLLYGNIPVRAPDAIERCIAHLKDTGASSVRTVAPIGRHHPDWLHRIDGDRMLQFRPNSIYRRQDLEPLYYHDGAVAAVTRQALFDAINTPTDAQSFLGPDRRAVLQRCEDAVDVDEAIDLQIAQAVLQSRENVRTCEGEKGRAQVSAAVTPFPHSHIPTFPRPVLVIAEAGVNHDGSLDKALRLIDAAVAAKADAVKFQVFRAQELACATAPAAAYQSRAGISSQHEMLRKLELPDTAWERIAAHCRATGIELLATPFGLNDVNRIVSLGVRRIKIASTDIDNLALLRKSAASGNELIVSCGAATTDEIQRAVALLRECGAAGRTTLLHCVSCYPTPIESANLRAIAALRERFGLPVGFSDHTRGIRTGAWAVAAGACTLEKHFTLDCCDTGPDHAMSLEPDQLRDYIDAVRDIEAALGDGRIGFQEIETDVRRIARKSVVAVRDIPAGATLNEEMLTLKRPAGEIPPDQLPHLIGRQTSIAIAADSQLRWSMIASIDSQRDVRFDKISADPLLPNRVPGFDPSAFTSGSPVGAHARA